MSGNQALPHPTRGVPVMLDKERHFRFSLKTLEDIQTEMGAGALSEGVSGHKLARVLWYGLKWEDSELTTEQVADMVDLENMESILTAMRRAMGTKAKAALEAVAGPLAEGDKGASPVSA
jgi:hypothetical protein